MNPDKVEEVFFFFSPHPVTFPSSVNRYFFPSGEFYFMVFLNCVLAENASFQVAPVSL